MSSPAYPKDLKQRAKVNEMMDWLNTQFYRDYGYGFIYPQIFPNNKRPSDAAQQACLEWSKEKAQNWLKILDQHWLGPRANYLCGDKITIADYLGVGLRLAGRGHPLRLRRLSEREALARQHEAAEEAGAR